MNPGLNQRGQTGIPPHRRRGVVVIIVALSLFFFIALMALVIDLGHLYVAKTELQNTADAAALAGAKELDGTRDGVFGPGRARDKAIQIAARNNYDFSKTVDLTDADLSICSTPYDDNTCVLIDSAQDPDFPNHPFLKVDTGELGLSTWFARVMNIVEMRTYGVAVAGRYPPGQLTPLFVPAIRRNANQTASVATAPYCNGVTYDPKDKNLKKNTCPYDPVNGGLVYYRVPDNTNHWGFLKANETKIFPDFNGIADNPPPPGGYATGETGNYYVINAVPNNNFAGATPWTPGSPWNGNFGFLLQSADAKTLNELAAALCRGGSTTPYSVPGCAPVHPGNLSGPKMADNINTRFDLPDSQQVQLPHTACPSDTNVFDPVPSPGWTASGYYTGYLAGSPLVSPTNYPPGQANRRLINIYVVDNSWLPGDNLPGATDDACYASALQGGSQDAHLVGCAQFFLWTKAQAGTGGKLQAEFVKTLPATECGESIFAFTEIRLYR